MASWVNINQSTNGSVNQQLDQWRVIWGMFNQGIDPQPQVTKVLLLLDKRILPYTSMFAEISCEQMCQINVHNHVFISCAYTSAYLDITPIPPQCVSVHCIQTLANQPARWPSASGSGCEQSFQSLHLAFDVLAGRLILQVAATGGCNDSGDDWTTDLSGDDWSLGFISMMSPTYDFEMV